MPIYLKTPLPLPQETERLKALLAMGFELDANSGFLFSMGTNTDFKETERH